MRQSDRQHVDGMRLVPARGRVGGSQPGARTEAKGRVDLSVVRPSEATTLEALSRVLQGQSSVATAAIGSRTVQGAGERHNAWGMFSCVL